jgi:hypothetical protein
MSTLGGTYVSIATPQPGTSNQPYPVGKLPPFVPVVTTIDSDHAAIILKQSLLVDAVLMKIHACLVEVNKSLRETKNFQTSIPPAVDALSPSIFSITAGKTVQTAIIAASAANQIKTNNFKVEIKKQAGDNPEMPTSVIQIKDSVVDSIEMTSASRVATAISNYGNSVTSSIANAITGTETYKTVVDYLKKAKDQLLSLIFPPTPTDVKSSVQAVTGIPVPGK